jgi:hypothetical protein
MNAAHVQEILHAWPPTKMLENVPNELTKPAELTSPHNRENVRLLGSFGGNGQREVAIPEAIDHKHWFQVGTRRIVSGPRIIEITTKLLNFVVPWV